MEKLRPRVTPYPGQIVCLALPADQPARPPGYLAVGVESIGPMIDSHGRPLLEMPKCQQPRM